LVGLGKLDSAVGDAVAPIAASEAELIAGDELARSTAALQPTSEEVTRSPKTLAIRETDMTVDPPLDGVWTLAPSICYAIRGYPGDGTRELSAR
jgi:hypothetical protein